MQGPGVGKSHAGRPTPSCRDRERTGPCIIPVRGNCQRHLLKTASTSRFCAVQPAKKAFFRRLFLLLNEQKVTVTASPISAQFPCVIRVSCSSRLGDQQPGNAIGCRSHCPAVTHLAPLADARAKKRESEPALVKFESSSKSEGLVFPLRNL